jgi:hypothetical protein
MLLRPLTDLVFFLGKTRGTGAQIVSNGDRLGALTMQGADGTDLVSSAEINGYVDGTPGANDIPGRLGVCYNCRWRI